MNIRETISFITIQTIMVCLLTFNPIVTHYGVAEAASPVFTEGAQAGLDNLYDAQGMVKGVRGNDPLKYSEKIKELREAGQKYIAGLSPKDRGILQTPKGARFLREHSRLARTYALKTKLAECVKDPDAKSNLGGKVLSGIENSEYTGGCDTRLTRTSNGVAVNSNMDDFVKDLGRVQAYFNDGRQNGAAQLQDAIHMQALKNSFSSYLAVRYKYEKEFIDKETGAISGPDLTKSVDDICQKESSRRISRTKFTKNYCTSAQKEELREFAKKKAVEIAATQEKSDFDKALTNIKASFNRLNKDHLNDFSVGVNTDGIDSADLESPATQLAWQGYNSNYLTEIQGQDGMLMLTNTVKEKAGGIKQLDKNVNNTGGWFFGKKYEIEKHTPEKLDEDILKEAKDEIVQATINEAKKLNEMAHQKDVQEKSWAANGNRDKNGTFQFGTDHGKVYDKRKEDLVRLVKINPTAVGQALMNNPELADIVCDVINQIDQEVKDDEEKDGIAMWGAIIVGGVLVGGLIACTIVTFGVCAGAVAAAAAAAGTTAAVVTTAGAATLFVAGGIEAAYWADRTYSHHKDHKEMEQSVLAGNLESEYAADIENAYYAYKDARFNMLMALPAVLLPGIGKLASLSKGPKFAAMLKGMNAATKARFLPHMTKIYQLLGKYPKFQKALNAMIKSGRLPAEKVHDFFTLLARGKKGINTKFLNWMSGKLDKFKSLDDPKGLQLFMNQFAKVVDDGLEAATKACKI